MVLSLFYHLDMVELVNTLRLGRRDLEFKPLYPDNNRYIEVSSSGNESGL